MEQKAKAAWAVDNPYELNPYTSLPAINIYTYDLGNLMSEYMEDEKAFPDFGGFNISNGVICLKPR